MIFTDNKEKNSKADITGVKILLAEDNELNAEIAQTLLVDEGANVTVVSDGEQAVREFARCAPHTYDVILMDIMMPKLDGMCRNEEAIRSYGTDLMLWRFR